jgi:hypothetical protein
VCVRIDPGKTGAVVALSSTGELLLAERTPLIGSDYHERAWINLLVRARNLNFGTGAIAGLEKVGTRPGESLRGAFTFGEGVGIWRGALAAADIRWRWITPQAWQRSALRGERKPTSRAALKASIAASASRAWPGLSDRLDVKKNWGMADAAWIAEHVRRTLVTHGV